MFNILHYFYVHAFFLLFLCENAYSKYIKSHIFVVNPLHYPEIRPDQPYVAVVPTSQKEPFSVKKRISQFSSAPKENAQATTLRPATDESGQVTSETSSSSEAIDKRKQEIDSLEKQLEGLRNIESSLQNAVAQKQETRTGLQYNTASGTLQRRNENLQLENQIRAQKEEQDLAEEEKKLNERKNESEEEVEDEMLQAKMSHKDTTEDLRDFLEDIKEDVKKDVEQTLKNQLQSKMGKQIEKLAKEVENKEEKEEEAVETEDSLQSKSAVDSFDMDEKNTAKAIEDLANNRRRMGKELQEQEDAEAQREAEEEALKSSTTDNCVGDLMPQRKPVSNSQAYFLNNKRSTDSRITLPALKISDTTHFISQHDYSLLPEEVAEATPDGSLSGEHPVPRSSSKKLREMKNKKKNITAPHQPPFITAGHQGTDFFSYGSHPHEDKAHTANDAIHHKHQDPHHHNERREELNAIQWLYFIILFPLGVASSALTLVFFV